MCDFITIFGRQNYSTTMKTSSLFLLGFSILMLTTQAQHRSINFEHGTFKEIKEKALKENKLIFIDAYTTWCGPCKYLSKYIFTNDTVADYYNTNFINTKFDMEKGEGIDMAKLYQVSCYPTLLFIDGNGKLVHRTAGSMPVSMLVALGKTAKEPEKNFSYFKTNYETKKTDPAFLMQYIDMISGTCMEPDAEVAYYFSTQKEADLSNEQNWNMIDRYTKHIDAREFKYLIANKAKFESLYTSEKVTHKIATTAKTSLQEAAGTTPFNKAAYDETTVKLNIAAAI
ncbi:MAG: thioredoxin family protein, partial [Bacteroidota bacterium]